MTGLSMKEAIKAGLCVGVGTALLYVGIKGVKEELDCSNNVVYHNITPYEKHIERVNRELMLEERLDEPIGLMDELKEFYYRDMGEAMSLSLLLTCCTFPNIFPNPNTVQIQISFQP